jgi:acetate---CoA ligase (ADP-forming) subunit beta
LNNIQILNDAQKAGKKILSEIESKQLLKQININTTAIEIADSVDTAVMSSHKIGFPIVLKIASPDITHKSDVGGVKTNLKTPAEVAEAYQEIMASVKEKFPQARIEGITVQNMARPGLEIIIGVTRDPQFGPVIMFGIGGIWVEVLKDVSFRLVPITPADAEEMIKEIKGYALLKGYRNMETANTQILADILLKISDFANLHPEIKEMDLNPVLAYKDEAIAVDARIILE